MKNKLPNINFGVNRNVIRIQFRYNKKTVAISTGLSNTTENYLKAKSIETIIQSDIINNRLKDNRIYLNYIKEYNPYDLETFEQTDISNLDLMSIKTQTNKINKLDKKLIDLETEFNLTKTTKNKSENLRQNLITKNFKSDIPENYKTIQEKQGIETNNFILNINFKKEFDYYYYNLCGKNILDNRLLFLSKYLGESKQNEIYTGKILDKFKNNNTYNSYLNCLNTFFKWLLENNKIEINYYSNFPKKQRKKVKTAAIEVFNDVELKTFFSFLETSVKFKRLYPIFFIMSKTGMRPEEAICLTKNDIDFKNNTIQISKAARHLKISKKRIENIEKITGKKINFDNEIEKTIIKDTKTSKIREVDMSPLLSKYFKNYIDSLPTQQTLLFLNESKNKKAIQFDTNNLNEYFKLALSGANLPVKNQYSLRHTYITNMLKYKTLAEVASIVGNSQKTLFTHYSHLLTKKVENIDFF